MTRTALVASIALVMLAGCSTTDRREYHEARTLGVLAGYLTGSFSSRAQSETDGENYFDIRLHAVPIWEWAPDGPWLYVEQAAASALDRPYRQRVYRLDTVEEYGETLYTSEVYTFDDPLRLAGAWKSTGMVDAELDPNELALRDGCTIYLTWDESRAAFVGATRGSGCESTLGGASYATSEVVLFADRLETWDRGFDAEGVQAWGATEGPYVFDRVE